MTAQPVGGGAVPYAEERAVFAEWLTGRRLAPATRRGYTERVDKYLTWLASYPAAGDPLADPHARDWAMRDYRTWLLTGAKAAPGTVDTTLTAVTALYDALGVPGRPTVDRAGRTRRAPRALGEAAQRRLLRAAEACGSTRDRAIVELLYDTGLRVGELAALDVTDVPVTARTGAVRVIGKGRDGGAPREVPLTARARATVRTWLTDRATRPGAGSPALWTSRLGTRMTTRSLRTVVTNLAATTGLELSPHTLRHTAATRWLRAGIDLVTVAELLGHAWVETTRIYTRPDPEHLTAAVEAGRVDY